MIRNDPDGVGLLGGIVVLRGCSAEIGAGHIILRPEPVPDKADLLAIERAGATQEIEHLDRGVRGVGVDAQGNHRHGRCLEGGSHGGLRKDGEAREAVRDGGEHDILCFVPHTLHRIPYGPLCLVLQRIK